MSTIALDYDGTYTADPILWGQFISFAQTRGHKVICVTMRYPEESVTVSGVSVIYTSRKAKQPFLDSIGVVIDIWIDDNPVWILTDSC